MRAMYLTITLQQGEPYAGWADQYTVTDLKPAHARSYEPRSVNTGTTVGMIYQMMEYYKLTADTRFLSGIPAAIKFLESQKLPETEVRKWHRKSDNPNEILVPRFIDPDTGKPLYVHRKGGNIYNGKYYIDQNIENTIAHYSSATFVNPEQLRKDFDEVKKIDKNKLLSQSPLLSDELCPLPKYYTHCPRLVTEKEISNLMAQVKNKVTGFLICLQLLIHIVVGGLLIYQVRKIIAGRWWGMILILPLILVQMDNNAFLLLRILKI